MKTLLLLILSLATGCAATDKKPGCVESTCKIPKDETPMFQSQKTGSETRRNTGTCQREDIRCCCFPQSYQTRDSDKCTPANRCQTVTHTAYQTAPTTITCAFSKHSDQSRFRFFCKEELNTCKEISAGQLSPSRTFTVTETGIYIRNVSQQDEGVYWCVEQKNNDRTTVSQQRIELKVKKIPKIFNRTVTAGQNFPYWCECTTACPDIFICKGEDPSTCQNLLNNTRGGRFLRKFTKPRKLKNATVTVRDVTMDDAGTYWCGSNTSRDQLFHRFHLTVVPPPTPSPHPSDQTSDVLADSHADLKTIICVIISVVLLLLIVLIPTAVYKRSSRVKASGRNGAAAEQDREDYVYEEIEEKFQTPSNTSASLLYSTIDFPHRAAAEALASRPGFSTCEYAMVKVIQSPTDPDVHQCPLYSTVYKPKQLQ